MTLVSMDFNVFNDASDEGFFTYSGGTIQITSDPFIFVGVALAANKIVQLGVTFGSFSLQSIEIVPEATTFAMIVAGTGLLLGVQRLRRKQS